MRAFLVLTEFGPRIVATPREMAEEDHLAESLSNAGIDRFIAHEVSVDRLRDNYGLQFEVIEAQIMGGKDFRVLDSNGRHVLAHLELVDLGPVIAHGF